MLLKRERNFMMTFNQKDEFILDNKRSDGMLVVDFNSQNILFSDAAKRFADNFPLSYAKILAELNKGETLYNRCVLLEENGFKLAVIVAQMNVVGDVDETEDIVAITQSLIKKLVERFPSESFVSGMLYKDAGAWKKISKFIKKLNVNWSIYAN